MEQAYISALAALSGTVVGGLTSFVTSWTTQQFQTRTQRIDKEIAKREEIYGRFIEEISRCYAIAVANESLDPGVTTPLMACKRRIDLFASEAVQEAANAAVRHVVELNLSPNLTAAELHELVVDMHKTPMEAFAHACRDDLRHIARGRFDQAGGLWVR